jgi:hypothetical protein
VIPHWLWHFLGADGQVWAYIWGGIGSILVPYFGMYVVYRWHNVCVEHRCIRVGKHPYNHPVTKAQVRACRKHHPDIDHTKKIHLHEWAKHR